MASNKPKIDQSALEREKHRLNSRLLRLGINADEDDDDEVPAPVVQKTAETHSSVTSTISPRYQQAAYGNKEVSTSSHPPSTSSTHTSSAQTSSVISPRRTGKVEAAPPPLPPRPTSQNDMAPVNSHPSTTTTYSNTHNNTHAPLPTSTATTTATHSSSAVPSFQKTGNDQFDIEVVHHINKLRTDPYGYAQTLKPLLNQFDGLIFKFPNNPSVAKRTEEGVQAVQEAISFLESMSPVGELTLSGPLSNSCNDLVVDNGPKGRTGNMCGNEPPGIRMKRYGFWGHKVCEILSYGDLTPKGVVDDWVVDDGDKERGNRKRLEDPDFTVIGVSHGMHSTYKKMCVVALTDTFTPTGSQ